MTFLDPGFLFALTSKRDAHHQRVVEVFGTFKGLRLSDHLLTTNHVIAETITLARKIGHAEAVRLGEQLYGEKLARVHWADPDTERAAFDYQAPRSSIARRRASGFLQVSLSKVPRHQHQWLR